MPRYKNKEKNKPFMKKVNEFRSECKDKLHYLQHQINELPSGKSFAADMIQSTEFREGLFGNNMKYADRRSES